MLPKPEKSKKQFLSDEFETIEETKEEKIEKEKKRIQKKRRLLVVAIILTVGLSLSFWVYRSVKKFFSQDHFSNIKFSFSLPKINFPSQNNLENQFQKLISSQYPDLSVYVADSSNQFIWQQNQEAIFQKQSLEDINKKLNQLTPLDKSSLTTNLPQGLKFQEIISNKDNFEYFSQITLPDRKLIILVNSPQEINISSLIESIYWGYLQKSN